ncbi:MAG: ribosome maturation factor RimM [Spirochaetaceae bacterium]|jgi:16S rRNA processing protein RimM|nr:ribosome maturation factor RimM [Spirochaetaceae bacterium]
MVREFVVGLLGAPFGLKGFIKVRSLSGEYEHISRLKTVTVRLDGAGRDWEVEANTRTASGLALKFRGIDTPEAARTLRGAELVIGREGGAPLGAGEFYVEDLKGITVVSPGGETLGVIGDVLEGGGGELVDLRLSGGESRLIPFRKEFFGDVSPETGRAVLLNRWIIE